MEEIVFVDVDTQEDFMSKAGALYIPGAEMIKQKLYFLTKCALFNKKQPLSVVAVKDVHLRTDEELKTFQPHCIKGTEGSEKIQETNILKYFINWLDNDFSSMIVSNDEVLDDFDIECIKNEINYIEIEKNTYNVFTNINAENILNEIKTAYVYGVATDYCVKATCIGLRKMKIEVFLVIDAIVSINLATEVETLTYLSNLGVQFISTAQVLNRFGLCIDTYFPPKILVYREPLWELVKDL